MTTFLKHKKNLSVLAFSVICIVSMVTNSAYGMYEEEGGTRFPHPSSSLSSPEEVSADEAALQTFHMGKSSPFQTTGFSDFEGTYRWTVGKRATITFPLENMEHRPTSVSFLNTEGFVTDAHPQNLIVKVNGQEAGRYVYTPSNNNQTINIDLPKIGPAEIEFEIPDAISPFDLGVGPDKRTFGISFREVQFH